MYLSDHSGDRFHASYHWVVLLLVSGSWTCSVGCQSRAMCAFEHARIGESWASVPGSELFSTDSPHICTDRRGPGEGNALCVVSSENGRVVAKAIIRGREKPAFELQIEAQGFRELMRVAADYPFPSECVTTLPAWDDPRAAIEVRRWTYAPLRNPHTEDDPVLPSGVRTSAWADLIGTLTGWPFTRASARLVARLDGKEANWGDLVKRAQSGTINGNVIVTD
jgi:hypothetical protein